MSFSSKTGPSLFLTLIAVRDEMSMRRGDGRIGTESGEDDARIGVDGFVSADGVLDSLGGEAESYPSGGSVARTEFVPEAFALKGEELAEATALMFGRRSYEAFAPIWLNSEDHAAYPSESSRYVTEAVTTEPGDVDED